MTTDHADTPGGDTGPRKRLGLHHPPVPWFGIWCAVAVVPAAIAMLPVVLRVRQRRAQRRSAGG